jgi:hypothetical protein
MIKKLIGLGIILIPAAALGEEVSQTIHYALTESPLTYSIIQSSLMSGKIIEYGITGAVSLTTIGWGAVFAKSLHAAYGELRFLGAAGITAISKGLAGAAEYASPAASKAGALAGKGVSKALDAAKGLKSGRGGYSFADFSPTDIRVDSLLNTGGVGVGRKSDFSGLLSGGKVGSSAVSSLKAGDRSFTFRGGNWFDESGQLASRKAVEDSIKQAGFAEVAYADGTTAKLQLEGKNEVREVFDANDLRSVSDSFQFVGGTNLHLDRVAPDDAAVVLNKVSRGSTAVLRAGSTTVAVRRGTDGKYKILRNYGAGKGLRNLKEVEKFRKENVADIQQNLYSLQGYQHSSRNWGKWDNPQAYQNRKAFFSNNQNVRSYKV